MKNAIISIGESIHASIPKTARIMKELAELGPDAYLAPSAPLDQIKALIESQVSDGADYIAVNLDAFGEDEAWYVPYTGGGRYGGMIDHQRKSWGSARHGYRCVRE